jgi:uncharacterized membrane protein YeaQ/YmgE (transglycosylase-associated protein family)
MGFLSWIVFGGLVGWIASKIMGTDAEQGIFRNIVVGIVGALLGGFLWGLIATDPEPYQFWDLASWMTAIIGASILLYLVNLLTRQRKI